VRNFWKYISAIALGILILVGDIMVRGNFGEVYAIRPTDLVIVILPAILWLLASGQIQSLKLGTGGLEVKSALQRAARSPITMQIEKMPISTLSVIGKEELDRIVSTGPQALVLEKHTEEWWDEYTVEESIRQLSKTEGFRLFVFEDGNGRFIGAISASDLVRTLRADGWERYLNPPQPGSGNYLLDVATLKLILNNQAPESVLKQARGFLNQDDALSNSVDKKTALAKMEELNTSWLPVIDRRTRKLFGVVEQSRLAASLVLDIMNALDDTGRRR